MKKYDYKKLDKYIELNKDNIVEVNIGMLEDYFWTGAKYYPNKEWNSCETTDWATPIAYVHLVDDTSIIIHCYIDDGVESDRPEIMKLLCMSGVMTTDVRKMMMGLDNYNIDDLINANINSNKK